MPRKRITIEDLARMVKVGFDETATRAQFGELEKRVGNFERWTMRCFDDVDRNFDAVKKGLTGIVYTAGV